MSRRLALAIWVAFAVVAGLLVAAVPASADVTAQDVEDARTHLREVQRQLENEVARYEEAVAEEAQLRDRLDHLLVELAARERAVTLARRAARDRAAAMYMAAGSTPTGIVDTEDVASLPARYVYLESVSLTDRDVVNRLETSRRDYEQHRGLVDESVAEQQVLIEEMEQILEDVYEELDAANEEYQAVKAEWDAQEEERRRQEFLATSTTTTTRPPTTTTSPGSSTTGATTTTTQPPSTSTTTLPPGPPGAMTCPVDGATTFSDSWGDPRPGSRTHKGTDLLAAHGTPLVAIEAGTIWSPNWDSAGGLGLYIRGDSGDTWYYAHLSSYVPGLVGGLRVEVGQRVGYVGDSGNATVPHLHLGWQPDGGAYANPYPIVAGLCG